MAPAWEFDRLIPHLRAAGWRTIRFDLFGHGLSDRPAVRYDFSFFLEQALEVLDGMSSHRPLTLLGHSFGAALAAAMASQRPERMVFAGGATYDQQRWPSKENQMVNHPGSDSYLFFERCASEPTDGCRVAGVKQRRACPDLPGRRFAAVPCQG